MKFKKEKHFLLAWNIGGSLTVLVPLLIFGFARVANRNDNNNDDDDDNNDDDVDNNNNEASCSWWQFSCSNNNEDMNDDDDNDRSRYPWWFWFGRREKDDRREEGKSNGNLVFVYLWTVTLFGVLLYYGGEGVRNGHETAVLCSMAFFANLAFVSLFLLGGLEGAIIPRGEDGPEMEELEENGWYGQFGVLMYLTNLFWLIFCAVFIYLVRQRKSSANVTKIDIWPSDYQIHVPTLDGTGGGGGGAGDEKRNDNNTKTTISINDISCLTLPEIPMPWDQYDHQPAETGTANGDIIPHNTGAGDSSKKTNNATIGSSTRTTADSEDDQKQQQAQEKWSYPL